MGTGQTRLTNSQAATHGGWLAKCSPHALGFSCEQYTRIFLAAIIFFDCNLLSVNPLECVSMNNQESKVRPEIVNVNRNEPVFYPFNIKTSKGSGCCNNINDPYAEFVCSSCC